MNNPSQHEANKVIRVLTGKRLKFTVTVHLPDGKSLEFQAEATPDVVFKPETRSLWLVASAYDSGGFLMEWVSGSAVITERNENP